METPGLPTPELPKCAFLKEREFKIILYIIYILYKYKNLFLISGKLKTRKTGVRESGVGSFKNWSKLFTNLKSYVPQSHREGDEEQRTGAAGGIVVGRGVCIRLTISDLQA